MGTVFVKAKGWSAEGGGCWWPGGEEGVEHLWGGKTCRWQLRGLGVAMLLWVWKLLISPNIYGWFHTETVTNICRSMVPSKLSYRPGLPQVVGTQGKQGTSQWSTGHDLWPHRNWWTQRLRRKRRSRRSWFWNDGSHSRMMCMIREMKNSLGWSSRDTKVASVKASIGSEVSGDTGREDWSPWSAEGWPVVLTKMDSLRIAYSIYIYI